MSMEATMEEFIQLATEKLGVSEESVKSAMGAILGLVQKNADGDDFQQLLDKLPGVEGLLSSSGQADSSEEGSGGLLSGLMRGVGSVIGGKVGDALGAASVLNESGLGLGHLGSLVTMFTEFARERVGSELVDKLLANVPGLPGLKGEG